jgi:hypothetical protein
MPGIGMELSLESVLESKIKTGLPTRDVCLGGHFYTENIPDDVLDAGITIPG